MTGNRIVYQNWIVDFGRDPKAVDLTSDTMDRESTDRRMQQICQAVGAALLQLDEDEREFIIHFNYMGESYRQISDKSGRPVYKLEALHKRSLKKLRKLLTPFVTEAFGLNVRQAEDCPICCSGYVEQLNEIILNRDPRQTWKPIMRLFREKYGLAISTPQLLMGHEKYH